MSYKASTRTNNNNTTKTTKQPFCKVCFDAKRKDYNTHFLKDFSGPQPVVLCPYLLALQCNYCKEQGHTVSYCEVLKAKKASESGAPSRASEQTTQSRKEPSQNGNFFILRVSKDKETTITHAPSKTAQTVSRKSISTTNQFALLEEDDDEEWEMPKYNKTKKSVSFGVETETVAVAAAAEPEPKVEVAEEVSTFPTWAKIVASPAPPKKAAPVLSAKEALKKDVANKFVNSVVSAIIPADFEKPAPKFIHSTKPSSTESKSIEKYFYTAPTNRAWDDDSSSEEDGW